MNRKKKVDPEEQNKLPHTLKQELVQLFNEMFLPVNKLPIDVRDEITRICDWSIPTFYRKLSGKDLKGASLAQLISIADIYLNNVSRIHETMKSVKLQLEKLRRS